MHSLTYLNKNLNVKIQTSMVRDNEPPVPRFNQPDSMAFVAAVLTFAFPLARMTANNAAIAVQPTDNFEKAFEKGERICLRAKFLAGKEMGGSDIAAFICILE